MVQVQSDYAETDDYKEPPKLKLRYLNKKQREERDRQKELAKQREEEEKQLEKQRDKEAHRKLLEAVRSGDLSSLETKKRAHGSADEEGGGRGAGDKPRTKLEALEQAVKEEQEARLRLKHYGPDKSKSKFVPNKKRKKDPNEFNFGWDDSEDTRDAQWFLDAEREKQQKDRLRHLLTSDKMFNMFGDEEDRELKALETADRLRRTDKENGEARAREVMENYFRARDHRNRPLRNMQHWSEKPLDQMRERDWRIVKEDFNISTKGGAIPNPMRRWRESDLPADLLDVVERVGYDEPTPIQRAAIPIALQGRDLIGIAVTGSGKTAAFLLPLLVYIRKLPALDEYTKNDGPYALILAPTRELAQQIESEARKFATPFGYNVVSIVGGHSLEEQAYALSNGAEIIVATPGRLVDCIERRLLVLSQCCYVIMDEADRMIDLGFEEPLNKILDAMPASNQKPDSDAAEDGSAMTKFLGANTRYRQTMMYTATMPPVVERIAKNYLRRPAIVTIGNAGEAVDTVEQRVEFIGSEDRRKERLREILQSHLYKPPIIVFVNIKRNCEMVARDVRAAGRNPVTLHGSKTQDQRESALEKLRAGQADVLVATDLAGRGIDVPDVSLVINFNMATTIEQYTHRVGRTGRAGKSGVAITFLGSEDNDVLYDLRQMISKSAISKVPEELRRHEAAQQKPTKGGDGGGGGKGGGNFGGRY